MQLGTACMQCPAHEVGCSVLAAHRSQHACDGSAFESPALRIHDLLHPVDE